MTLIDIGDALAKDLLLYLKNNQLGVILNRKVEDIYVLIVLYRYEAAAELDEYLSLAYKFTGCKKDLVHIKELIGPYCGGIRYILSQEDLDKMTVLLRLKGYL